jgi:hypothetical protein
MMNDRPHHDIRPHLDTMIQPLARAARLVLLLDERQPDDLRAEALTMPAERLFWTLTQLDGGLDLDVCRALVRATRVARGRRPPPVLPVDDLRAAEAAAQVARGWLRRRWAALPMAVSLIAWLASPDGLMARPASAPPPTPVIIDPVVVPADGVAAALVSEPLDLTAGSWLDLPPLVGPPPGAGGLSLIDRLVVWLTRPRRRC